MHLNPLPQCHALKSEAIMMVYVTIPNQRWGGGGGGGGGGGRSRCSIDIHVP